MTTAHNVMLNETIPIGSGIAAILLQSGDCLHAALLLVAAIILVQPVVP